MGVGVDTNDAVVSETERAFAGTAGGWDIAEAESAVLDGKCQPSVNVGAVGVGWSGKRSRKL